MKSKLKLGLIVASALIFSASFGYIVRQMIKGREAESAFQSLSEQISETEPETTPAETSMPESLVSEETLLFLSSEEEEHAVSGSPVFRFRFADRKRADESNCRCSSAAKKEARHHSRRNLRHYPDALDLYPVLYVPAEFHVHGLLPVRPVSGRHWVCSMEDSQK